MEFSPAPSRNQAAGWSVEKQRIFLETLAATGSVQDSAAAVFLSPRSAYKLRGKPGAQGFARAWDLALQQCGGRLLAHAFDRALHGGHRRVWKEGNLTIEETNPSDRLLIYLIDRIGPAPFRRPDRQGPLASHAELVATFPDLADDPDEPVYLSQADYAADPTLPVSD